MTAAEKRAKNRDRNKENWNGFSNAQRAKISIKNSFYMNLNPFNRANIGDDYTSEFIKEVNKEWRNGNKRLITYLNRTARAEHMKRHGKTPKPVKTIRQMYLDEKKISNNGKETNKIYIFTV